MIRVLLLCLIFSLTSLSSFAKELVNRKYLEVGLSQKFYTNRVSKNGSIPIHILKEADLGENLKFHFGNSGFAKVDYEKGNFLKRQATLLFAGNPVVRIVEATVFDNNGTPHKCMFSKKANKIKKLRVQQNVHRIDVSTDLLDLVVDNTLNTALTTDAHFNGFETDEIFYCHFL